MRKALFLTVALLLGAGPARAQERPNFGPQVRPYISVDAPVVALTGVKLIDGTGAASRDGQTVVIEGTQIKAVGDDGAVDVPDGAEVLDLAGHTVTPGFIGMHNHSYYSGAAILNHSAPRLYLASGVTTIRTTGSFAPYAEINLHESIQRGAVPGPYIFVTGPYLTGAGGSPSMTRLEGPEDARRVVRYWAEEGATWFKAYMHITRDQLAAAIDEAHKHGIKVTAHLCSVTYQEAVAMGIDNLEHGLAANTDYVVGKEPDQCPLGFERTLPDVDIGGEDVQRTFQAMIDSGVGMTSTLAVIESLVPGRPGPEQRVLDAMSDAAKEQYLNLRDQMAQAGEDWPYSEAVYRKLLAYEYAFVQAGGLLAAGVDPGGGALPGYGDQRNYELLLEAGFTPAEVIQIMTLNGAKILGIDDEVGTVAPGRRADLVVIRGDIEANPAEIRNVTTVFRDGVGYDSAKLIADVEGMVGLQ